MMKRITNYQFIMFMVFFPLMIHSSCTAPVAGERLWDIAANNLLITCSTESKVSALEVIFSTDFAGTFTVLQALLSLVCTIESKAEQLGTSIDILISQVSNDVSKVNYIEEHMVDISSELELIAFDMDEIFTTLDGLKNSVSSKIDLLNVDLIQLDDELLLLIQTAIADGITIASNLDLVSQEVASINSLLDIINIESELDISSSLVTMLVPLYNSLESNVDELGLIIATGFTGTFTALEANLMLACTIESLVDALPETLYADLSSTYSALAQLQATVSTIDGQVDIINAGFITINSEIDLLEPKFILIDSKLVPIASQASILADDTASIGLILAQDVLLLNKDNSILDQISQNTLSSIVSVIESSIESVEIALTDQNSSLSEISSELAIDASNVCTIVMNNETAMSKLLVAGSKLDLEFIEALTIESLIDTTIIFANSIDEATSKSQLISSDLDIIEMELMTISSKLDLLNDTLSIIDTTLDNITATAVNNLIESITIESKVSNIVLEQSAADLLTSKLAMIESEAATISSKLVIVDSIIPELVTTAQGLAVDFQETWTILDSISAILAADQSVLEAISGNPNLAAFDYSGVYTTINSIIVQKLMVDEQVDTAVSLVDALNSIIPTDFNGVFTALNQVSTGLITINSEVDLLNSHVNILDTYFGIPIYSRDLGTTGYVITRPGRYYLAEDILFTSTVNFTAAIFNSGIDNVTIDLNEKVLAQNLSTTTAGNGIMGFRVSNMRVLNGAVNNFTSSGVFFKNSSNILVEGLNVVGRGTTGDGDNGIYFLESCNEILVDNCFIVNTDQFGLAFDNSNAAIGKNVVAKNINVIAGNTTRGFGGGIYTWRYNNVVIQDSQATSNLFYGIIGQLMSNIVISNCYTCNNGMYGICLGSIHPNIGRAQNADIKYCMSANNTVGGIVLEVTNGSFTISNATVMNNTVMNNQFGIYMHRQGGAAPGVNNSFIGFNTSINNTSNNIVEGGGTGPNTYLGNFAFNSTAVGNPNNTNYSVVNSNITRKFITVSQSNLSSKLPALSGEWYNMNMLP